MPIDARCPTEIRAAIRNGALAGVTAGPTPGFVHANLASVYDFPLFCGRNPRPCPLITHGPGRMVITDLPNHALAAF